MHDQMEFVRGVFYDNDLSNTAVVVGTAGKSVRVKAIRLTGGGALEEVIFQSSDGNATEYFREPIPSGNSNRLIDVPWNAVNGLQVLTATAASGVGIYIFYYDD